MDSVFEGLEDLKSINKKILQVWERLSEMLSQNKTEVRYSVLKMLRVKKGTAFLDTLEKSVDLRSFASHFEGQKKVLGDKLPEKHYWDLSENISKIDGKDNQIISSLKDTLEEILHYYESLEKAISEETHLLDKVRQMFKIPGKEKVVQMRDEVPGCSLPYMEVEIRSGHETVRQMNNVATLLYSLFERAEFRNAPVPKMEFVSDNVAVTANLSLQQSRYTIFKRQGDNKWNCLLASTPLEEGIHVCKIRLDKISNILVGIHEATSLVPNMSQVYNGTSCFFHNSTGVLLFLNYIQKKN